MAKKETLRRIKRKPKEVMLNRSIAGNAGLLFFISLMGVIMFLPMLFTIMNAFKPLDEMFYFPPRFFVRNPTMDNFFDLGVLLSTSWVPFSRYVLNTLIITGFGVVGHVLISSMAAYPISKHDFPGQKVLLRMVVLSLMFAGAVTAIPNYIIISALGMNNTYLAVIVPAFSYSLGFYLMKNFIDQLPDSLLESARMDGAKELRVYWSIVMPNVKPAWLTLTILQFQVLWGTTGGQFLRSEQLKPLNYALGQIVAGNIARQGAGSAVGLIMMSVPVTFFIVSQSKILQTMATSGMKE
ncbi:MAG: carbohydrate ABC transporter permease [Defluviitaleaceae bacterium]|nr:carbohydrate ABC transporter permease [Defluviitaleaceae bacterium]